MSALRLRHDLRMPGFTPSEGRRSKRVMVKKRASLIVNPERKPERSPCLVLDSSKEGFRVRETVGLRPGRVVEVVLDDDKYNFPRCRVVWVGKAGSKQEGEVGLEILSAESH